MIPSQPAVLDDVLDSLEAELASFRAPVQGKVPAPNPGATGPSGLPACDNDDVQDDWAVHFVIAAYRAC